MLGFQIWGTKLAAGEDDNRRHKSLRVAKLFIPLDDLFNVGPYTLIIGVLQINNSLRRM